MAVVTDGDVPKSMGDEAEWIDEKGGGTFAAGVGLGGALRLLVPLVLLP